MARINYLYVSIFIGYFLFFSSGLARSQILPDKTLGELEKTVVIKDIFINGISSVQITGGARRRNNLFHSFEKFNVKSEKGAYFIDPGVDNIFARVTGALSSTINGKLGVSGANANLFCLTLMV